MWWSCFSWDLKGPYHIWEKETKQSRDEADSTLAAINKILEPLKHHEWTVDSKMKALRMDRVQPGKKPTWRWSHKTGKIIRSSKKGGIDWWRYQKEVLQPKLIPFAQRLERHLNNEPEPEPTQPDPQLPPSLPKSLQQAPPKLRRSTRKGKEPEVLPGLSVVESSKRVPKTTRKKAEEPKASPPVITKDHPYVQVSMATPVDYEKPPPDRIRALVQEDNAPAHSFWLQQHVFDRAKVLRLLWPGQYHRQPLP